MYCSVKFWEPTVIVGPLPPSSSALGPEPPLLPTLPQPMSSATRSTGTARINFVLFFTVCSFVSCLPTALLRDSESLGGHAPLQRAEADLRDDGKHRHRERSREQDCGVVALGALDYEVPESSAADERR